MSRITLIRALVESARPLAKEQQIPLTEVLGGIRNAIFNGEIVNGKVLISTSESDGSVSFTLPAGHTPMEVMTLVQEAIDWCNGFADPNNPPTSARRIMRLRASFARATI